MRGRCTHTATWLVGLLAALVGTFATAPPASAATAPTDATASLAQLLGLLARRQGGRAHFRQTQHLAVVTRALISEGTLIYRAPDYLEQRVSRPRPQDLILDHGQLSVQVGHHHRTIALADYPQLAALLDSVRATLAGDQAALEQRFMTQLQGSLERWQLTLTPRDPQVPVRSIVLRGAGAQIRQVHITQASGDESDLHIEPLTPEPASERPE